MASLLHDPAGRQHPYEPAAYERSPERPVAGDEVSIGVVTRPAGSWHDICVEWWMNDGQRHSVSARLVDSGSFDLRADEVAAGASNDAGPSDEEDRWVAMLPPAIGGAQVRYRVHGMHFGETRQSDTYSYGVAQWADAQIEACSHSWAIFRLAGSETRVMLRWHGDEKHVRFSWTRQNEGEQPEGESTTEGEACVRVDGMGRLEIMRGGESLLLASHTPQFLVAPDGALLQVRQTFDAPQNERFFGLGERFNALNQRGEELDVRVYEQYKGQGKRTYMPVPLLHSSRGYSLYLQTKRRSSFDLAASAPEIWSFAAELDARGNLDFSLFLTGTITGTLATYCELTGFPKPLPEWAFSLWASSNDWDSQQHVEAELSQMRTHDIPIGVIVLEAWSDEVNFYIWNNAQYTARTGGSAPRLSDFTFPTEGKWPNPKAMIDALHAQGIRLILWQIPVLKHVTEPALQNNVQHHADEEYMLASGYAVMMPNGSPYRVRPPWFRGSLLPDFTNPEASRWWQEKRRYLVEEMGVDGFKTDGGEHLWAREAIFADGARGDELWNVYPVEYTRVYTEMLEKSRPGEGILFSRAGYAGAQQYPAHWTGDEVSTWDAFRASLLAMLNAGLSGIPFIGWDIAGFSGPIPTAELYLRAAAMSVFCPIMQYHSEYWRGAPSRDRSPWNMQACTGDQRVIPHFRRFVQWRNALRPYIVANAQISAQTGAPLMRALPVDFMHDVRVHDYPLQYMFGASLLVAPVTAPGVTSLAVYLPAGEDWVDLWNGTTHTGGIEITVDTPLDRIPLFLRADDANPLPDLTP